MNNSIFPCLWFDKEAQEAADFYAESLGAKITSKSPVVSEIAIGNQKLMLLNGGPYFKKNASISLMIIFGSASELELCWEKLSQSGNVLMPLDSYPFADSYGWVIDKFGTAWQLYFKKDYLPEQRMVPTLMFCNENNGKAAEAIAFYTQLFPNSSTEGIMHYRDGGETEEVQENIQHAEFILNDYKLACMDSSLAHNFNFNEGISLVVNTETQEETDHYWNTLTADGGSESRCGWLKDKFGLSWQIVPKQLISYLNNKDNPEGAKRAMEAMLKMNKIVISDLEEAFNDQ